VCENIPYSYKSDVWALGCVLYELCTLKHAFSASNLLGLVYKIIQEKQEPIPDIYSNNMKTLVSSLLTKDHKKRPDIAAIFKFDFVQDIAKSFVDKKGEVKQGDFVPVIKRTEVHLEKDLQEMGGKNITNMTPKEKMEMKKRLEAEKNKEKMTQAIMENRSGMAGTKDRRQKEMMSSMDTFKYSTTAKAVKPSPVVSQVVEGGKMSSSQMDKSREFYGEGTLESKYEMTKPSKKPMDQTYKDLPTQTINTMNLDSNRLLT
jgi:serine/threonine protein kinase